MNKPCGLTPAQACSLPAAKPCSPKEAVILGGTLFLRTLSFPRRPPGLEVIWITSIKDFVSQV